MHYSYEIDVTTSHTVDDPLIYHVKLASGKLTEMQTVFEVGDGYSSCVTLWDGSKQLLPTNLDGYFTGDGLAVYSPINYDLTENGNNLYLVAWNRGGVYDHAVNVMLAVKGDDEPDVLSLMTLLNATVNRLIDLCRALL